MHSAQATITAAVNELRHARHERQEDLAPVLGYSQAGVSRRLAGKTRWTADDLDALAQHFAVPLPRLLSATNPYRAAAGQGHEREAAEATLP